MIGQDVSYVAVDDIAQIQRLLREFFGDSYYGADEKFIRWQYFLNPHKELVVGRDQYSMTVIKDDAGKVLALDAFVPWKTFVRGVPHKTVWDIEWINFSQIKGLGRELVKYLRSQTEIYCGYGMNELSWRAYQKLEYTTRDSIERYVAIVDAQRCWELFGNPDVAGQKDFLWNAERRARVSTRYVLVKELKMISETYWRTHLERFDITSIKDIPTLRWRYAEHPYLEYLFIALNDTASTGLAVVRVEKVKGVDCFVLRILDLFPTFGHEEELVEAVLSFARDKGCVLADFFCAADQKSREICPRPFMPLAEHVSFDVPMLFQPVEVRARKSINMVLDVDVSLKSEDFQGFYATKGDGDQDVYVNPDYRTVSL